MQPLKHFGDSLRLHAMRLSRDVDRIAREVVQHLTGLVKAEVEVTLGIQPFISEGAPDVVRVVTDNCRTLKFTTFGFERG